MDIGQRYAKLMDIASENSSHKRRELLNEVTQMFFSTHDGISEDVNLGFGDLMGKIAFELDTEMRTELAIKFENGLAPRNLALSLANDEISVAEPILRNTHSFTDDDLVGIVANKGTKYQMAISQRRIVSETVSNALVDHGNDEVLHSLLRNDGAQISDDTFDKVIVRAENNKALQGPIIKRKKVTIDVLNQMFAIVSGPMREEIMSRYKDFSEDQIKDAMVRAQTRVSILNQILPKDYETKLQRIQELKAKGQLNPANLPNIWREGDKTTFYIMFSEISGLDYHTISRPFEKGDIDSIAIICRANGFARPLFVTLAVFVLGKNGMGAAETLGNMYNNVPQESAARALRFMQVKAKAA
jgi:uncharacterized protein (DUF2336 family)